MITQQGKIDGPYTFTEDSIFHGMVTIEATVAAGVTVMLHGMVTGDLIVEQGARVVIHGMVNGTVRNGGHAEVWGTIDGFIDTSPKAATIIHANAHIKGRFDLPRNHP